MKRHLGIVYGLLAAVLFGCSTPAAKWLLGEIHPQLLAGLLYLGAGLGLSVVVLGRRFFQRAGNAESLPSRRDLPWLGGAVLAGGIIGPVFLMRGLFETDAASAALLLNLEGVFTALLAWFVFRENFDRRIAFGMTAILAGSIVLAWPAESVSSRQSVSLLGPLLVAAACLAWAADNNLTRKISGSDPVLIALVKGSVAGTINALIAYFVLGERLPSIPLTASALGVGFLGYGLSLVCFILALRHLGAARTGAYFSTGPICGALLAIIFGQGQVSLPLVIAGGLMALGLWLHLSERHVHEHDHELLNHEHPHVHDEHHLHDHLPDDPPYEPHTHPHRHDKLVHIHEHYPDIHHRHNH